MAGPERPKLNRRIREERRRFDDYRKWSLGNKIRYVEGFFNENVFNKYDKFLSQFKNREELENKIFKLLASKFFKYINSKEGKEKIKKIIEENDSFVILKKLKKPGKPQNRFLGSRIYDLFYELVGLEPFLTRTNYCCYFPPNLKTKILYDFFKSRKIIEATRTSYSMHWFDKKEYLIKEVNYLLDLIKSFEKGELFNKSLFANWFLEALKEVDSKNILSDEEKNILYFLLCFGAN